MYDEALNPLRPIHSVELCYELECTKECLSLIDIYISSV